MTASRPSLNARGRHSTAEGVTHSRFDLFERAFDNGRMLDVAIRKVDGTTAVDLGRRAAPPLPVHPALSEVLPGGLRRGSTVAVSGSISLLLATLGAASAGGAWCALVGLPTHQRRGGRRVRHRPVPAWRSSRRPGIRVDDRGRRPARRTRRRRRAPAPPRSGRRAASGRPGPHPRGGVCLSSTAVAASGPAPTSGCARGGQWSGIGDGTGRLRARRVEVHAEGRGQAARPALGNAVAPGDGGGIAPADPAAHTTVAPVIELAG